MQNMHVHRIRTVFITLSCNNGLSAKPNKLTNKMVKNKETTKRGYCDMYCQNCKSKKVYDKKLFHCSLSLFPLIFKYIFI